MDDQTLACQELNNLLKMKSEMEYFEKTFLNALGLGYDQNLSYLSQKYIYFKVGCKSTKDN